MPPPIPHPTNVSFTNEEVARRFVQFRPPIQNPLWQCELLVERSHRVGPKNEEPKPNGPMTSLALLNRPDPPCDLEIFTQWLDAEIDPADWLNLWLPAHRITPISIKRAETLGGHIGDVLGSWNVDGAEWLGRFFCLKAGPRLALLWFRAPAPDYPRIADDIFLSMATFAFLDESPGPLAEKVRWIANAQPIPWRVAIPVSWDVKSETPNPNCASFQANLLSTATPPILLGKLSYAVTSADQATTYEAALAQAIAAVTEAGVKLSSDRTVTEKPSPPFTESWLVFATADIAGQPGEFRCRILRHPKVWVMAVVLSVDQASSPQAWMRAMRLLNVATSTIEFT
jgi:hypothetical protein